MINNFSLLSQHVDTFKEALYLEGDKSGFNDLVDAFSLLKDSAQEVHHKNNDMRFVDFEMAGLKFHAMAVSIKGYSVVLKTGDFSMAFKKYEGITDKNPSVKIEYRAEYLVKMGIHAAHKQVNDFFKENIHSDYLSKVQEIHLACDTQGHNFSFLDTFRFKTRSRKSSLHDGDDGELGRLTRFNSRRVETLYFGTSDLLLRIYDKTREIVTHPESGHIRTFWQLSNPEQYDENKDVWRVEFQIRREILKELFTSDKLPWDYTSVLLDNLPSLWSFFVDHFSYRDLDRDTALHLMDGYKVLKNGSAKLLTKEATKKIFQRSEIHPFWEMISTFKNVEPSSYFRFKQVKETSPVYAENSASALISTLVKHYGYLDDWMIISAFEGAEARCRANNDGIGLVDNAYKKTSDYFNKVDIQRKRGLNVIEIDDDVKENLSFYVANVVRPMIDGALLQPIF